MASQVGILRMFGLGVALAVLADATVVRMLLVPSFMHLLGPVQLVGAEAAAAVA